ncbi:MAG: hypothetical protein ABJA60_01270 [Nitrosospira sp.]
MLVLRTSALPVERRAGTRLIGSLHRDANLVHAGAMGSGEDENDDSAPVNHIVIA